MSAVDDIRAQRQKPQTHVGRGRVRGGGPTHQHLAHVQHSPQTGSGARLETALRHNCAPQQPQQPPPPGGIGVRGGGAAAAMSCPPAGADPAGVVLAALLTDGSPPDVRPSMLNQLATQLTTILAQVGARLSALIPARGGDAAAAATTADQPAPSRVDAPVTPMQPLAPQPPGPLLTLDPVHGTIVEPNRGPNPDDESRGPQPNVDAEAGLDDSSRLGLPSSWVPIAGYLSRRALSRRLGSIVDRIDALLDEVGITRLQLLLLLALAPLATAFLIDVAASVLAGR